MVWSIKYEDGSRTVFYGNYTEMQRKIMEDGFPVKSWNRLV